MSAKRSGPEAVLEAAGYEVSRRGATIRARKTRDDAWSYTIVLASAGSLRFSATRITCPPEAATEREGGRAYRVTRAQQRVTTILAELDAGDDLAQVIAQLEGIEQRAER